MIIYKGEKSCNCDASQLDTMKKAGWSISKPKAEAKPEGKPEAKQVKK